MTRKQYLLLGALALQAASTLAQQAATLSINDMQVRLFANGRIGYDPATHAPAMIVPAGSGTSPLFTSGFWMFGRSSTGMLKGAAHFYEADGQDYFPGPLTTDGSATITPEVSQQYDQVWSILRSDVEEFRGYHACLSDPDCDTEAEFPDYTIPVDLLTWPAMGNVDAGQALHLAPFTDVNSDGVYDPQDGDHPCVPGDQALFCIFNDAAGLHTETNSEKMGVEVQLLLFAYHTNEPVLDGTVFAHYRIINRSAQALHDFRIGMFNDFDLGCPDDDFVGTDAQRNLVFAYNWQDVDPECLPGVPGYGEHPPAFGMTVLKGPLLDADGADNGTTFNEGYHSYGTGYADDIVDNERSGLSGSIYFNRQGNANVTDPDVAAHFYNYLDQVWKNNYPMTYGGNGYSEDLFATRARFMFPGDSDLLGLGTGGAPQPDWRETAPTPALPDRRMTAAMGPITLEAGEIDNVLLAYVYARADAGGAGASVERLREHTDAVRAFAAQFPADVMNDASTCELLDHPFTGILERPEPAAALDVFPVPATDRITVNTQDLRKGTVLQLMDARGAMVQQRTVNGRFTAFELDGLSDGLYLLRALDGGRLHTARFTKGL